ncbi:MULTISPECIES: Ger(x)C family spore germination C-terminal domain-containing protein [Bacillus]|jgi:hypothetical protein|uniref:Spore germination GerAC-like C-terminal domain-containing protein n=1 Tax=Bacillus mycoides TaxID=1405 RepID=A0AAP8BHB6_BACMY|nr:MULTISPECIES: Ger(x)C family spore germination C-terminal domain-containing protein [Bacillus]EEM00053.1 Spore germination protein [Bacillus mycoides DSM 2048]KUH46172.1 hypothetical protein M2E15_1220 [Bacillus mycoides]MDI6533418.1 Ger(x)C family spore germination C-terminal domain-containing protein [Bacillus mycoides]MDR4901114.1 Ger(x)C family spore germination C-terminal domain-containing protein [Bacillus mycoides]MED0886228.1 Ger(x)C family spore germination C-terminal domain-contai
MKKDKGELVALIMIQLNHDLNDLIHKVQRQKLDPFGFGDYARTFQYEHWKKSKMNGRIHFQKQVLK